jgi:hypothetical protein
MKIVQIRSPEDHAGRTNAGDGQPRGQGKARRLTVYLVESGVDCLNRERSVNVIPAFRSARRKSEI